MIFSYKEHLLYSQNEKKKNAKSVCRTKTKYFTLDWMQVYLCLMSNVSLIKNRDLLMAYL